MRAAFVIVVAGASTAAAFGEAWIEGRVVARVDGRETPRSGVAVSASQRNRAFGPVTTDSDGRYRLPVPAARPIRVHIAATGWTTHRAGGFDDDSLTLDCSAGGLCGEVDFEVAPHGVLTGRVLDPFGGPGIGARIQIRGPDGGVRHQTTADDRGRYRVWRVEPGVYEVQAFLAAIETRLSPYNIVSDAVGVSVEAAETVEVPTLTLRLERKRDLAGVVEGVEAEGLHLRAVPTPPAGDPVHAWGMSRIEARIDGDNRFKLANIPQVPVIFLIPDGPDGPIYLGALDAPGDQTDLRLRPQPGGELRARVEWEGASDLAAVEWSLVGPGPRKPLRVDGSDQRLKWTGLPPGSYRILIFNGYVRTADPVEGRPSRAVDVEIGAGETREADLVGGDRFGRLTGRIRKPSSDDAAYKPAAHAMVLMVSEEPPGSFPADQFGAFEVLDATPGLHRVCVVAERTRRGMDFVERCRKGEIESRLVPIEPGGEVDLEWTIKP